MSRPQDTPLLAHKRSCLSQITIHLVGCDVLLRSSPREEVTTVNIRLCRTLTHMTGMQEQVGYKVRAATGNNFPHSTVPGRPILGTVALPVI